jgi:hypothetical protein
MRTKRLEGIFACALALGLVAPLAAAEEERQPPRLEVHFRTQGWYQWVEDGAPDGAGALHDFQLRRAYLSLAGQVTPKLGVFAHLAADRLGQQGLDVPSLGLGSGLAVRDAWVVFDLAEPLKVQVGRMYVPFTRAFGTESTFTLLALDIPWTQGGVRGATFYPGKVGRDDGLVVWGNFAARRLQYRVGVTEGVEDAANPSDAVRLAGRLAVNLLEPESAWFNSGTYLGTKRVLAIGAGFDSQCDLTLAGRQAEDYSAWTVDVFLDHPVGRGSWTAEAGLIQTTNTPGAVAFTQVVAGDDHRITYLQAGYLLPPWGPRGRVQLYGRQERLDVEERPDTRFTSLGLNYLLDGHQRKLTLDWTRVDQGEARTGAPATRDRHLVTIQVAVGF